MTEHDAFDALVAASPVRALQEVLPGDEQMLATILAEPRVAATAVPRSQRRYWAAAGASTIVILMAAFAVLRHESPHDPTTMICYGQADVDSSEKHQLPSAADPVAACRELWDAGLFGPGEVPNLTACVTDTGVVAVIPGGEQVCGDLGFAIWSGTFEVRNLTQVTFSDELTATFRTTCYSQSAAISAAQKLLDKYELDDWTIATNNNWTNTLPCTASGINPESKSVTLGSRPKTDKDVDPKG